MSRCRIHGSNGDNHAIILDSSSGVVLKLFVMLKAFWILLKACDIFPIFAALDVGSGVLINLGSVKAIMWNGGKEGLAVKPCAYGNRGRTNQ